MKEKNNKQKEIDADDRPILKYKPIVDISNGIHEGKIITVEKYETEYTYLRFGVLPNDIKLEKKQEMPTLKFSVPLNLSNKTELGKLLIKSGYDITVKDDYSLNDIKKIILNRTIRFKVFTDATKGDIFSEIETSSIEFI